MFGTLVIAYLFLGGAGAGALTLATVLCLLIPRENVTARLIAPNGRRTRTVLHARPVYRRFITPVYAVALVALAFGALALTADLGIADRAWYLFAMPHPTFMTLGAFSLVAALVLCLALGAAWALPQLHWSYRLVQVLQVAGLVVGFVVMAYTGFLLSDLQAVPFWHTGWLPALFILSSLSCGCAVVLGASTFSGALDFFATTARHMLVLDVVVIAVEVAVVVGFLATAMTGPYATTAAASAQSLLIGADAPGFWGGFALCGIGLPLALEIYALVTHRGTSNLTVVASAALLVGGFVLRYSVVIAGIHPLVWM